MRLLTAQQQRSLGGAVAGVIVGAVVFALVQAALPPVGRAAALAAALLAPAIVVFGLTLAVAFGRFLTQAFDPLTQRESRYLQVTQRALTNSLEQGVVFALAAAALALAGGPAWHSGVVALAVTFALARLAFWLGYLAGTFGRAPGMAATMAVNLATLLAALAVSLG